MHKVIVIRHSDEDNQNSKYVANLQKNKDGSYSASVGVVKEDGYNDYVSKHGLHFTKALTVAFQTWSSMTPQYNNC